MCADRTRCIFCQQFALFAVAATLLAAVGLYGLMTYTVTQRTQEVGVRMALGATATRVLRAFLAEALSVVLVGLAAGLIDAAVATRLLSSLVFDVTPHDPITFVAVSATLIAVAGLATLFPSLQAARTDPARAMRVE